jgi:fumarylacetoacetate (FAA) hydrolase family protein
MKDLLIKYLQIFNKKIGDVVTISSKNLGELVNEVSHSNLIDKWDFGILEFMKNLKNRNLL